jgi:hypothetical protein
VAHLWGTCWFSSVSTSVEPGFISYSVSGFFVMCVWRSYPIGPKASLGSGMPLRLRMLLVSVEQFRCAAGLLDETLKGAQPSRYVSLR